MRRARWVGRSAIGICLLGLGLRWLTAPVGPAAGQTVVPAPAPVREHADEVASYEIVAKLDPVRHVVAATGSIRWRNASNVAQRELWLHLYLNAWKTDRTVFNRKAASGFRGAATSGSGRIDVTRLFARELGADLWAAATKHTPGDPDDETEVRLELPREVAPGEVLTLEVAWEAHLPPVVLRTGHDGSFHMVAQWFPKIAKLERDGTWAHFSFHRFSEFYADFGSYDVTVDVPTGFTVGATGKRTSVSENGGRTVSRFVQGDVHDFAFTAWDRFRERTARGEGGVEIRCLYPPGYDEAADVEIAAAQRGLSWLGAAYGAYPYETLTIVHPPAGAREAGGMEYPTLITTGGSWALPWTGVRALEAVTIHELGHQWFYGLVATNEHRFPFLDEGINSFADADAMEAFWPGASGISLAGLRLSVPAAYRVGSLRAPRDAVTARAAPAFESGGDYGALVYTRTATTLLTLARTYGADRVRAAIGLYARRHRFGHPTPDDLFAAIEEGVGQQASIAARRVLVEGGWIDLAADDVPASVVDGATWRASPLVRRMGSVQLPVDVDLVGEDGTVQRVRWHAEQDAAHLTYEGPTPLAAVVIDPEQRVLLDVDLSNNARSVRPSGSARTTDRLALLAHALVHLLLP